MSQTQAELEINPPSLSTHTFTIQRDVRNEKEDTIFVS